MLIGGEEYRFHCGFLAKVSIHSLFVSKCGTLRTNFSFLPKWVPVPLSQCVVLKRARVLVNINTGIQIIILKREFLCNKKKLCMKTCKLHSSAPMMHPSSTQCIGSSYVVFPGKFTLSCSQHVPSIRWVKNCSTLITQYTC